MKHLRLFAGALLAASLLSGRGAEAAATCVSREALAAWLAARLPQAATLTLDAADARVFLAGYAAASQSAAPAADAIVIVATAPQAPLLRIVLFQDGCLTRIDALPRRLVDRLLNDVARTGA